MRFSNNPTQQLIGHNIRECHIISIRKQIKENDFQWLETTFLHRFQYRTRESEIEQFRVGKI